MSDLSPLSAPERKFTNASRIDSRPTNPHCPHCGCGAQGRPVAPWLRQNNPSGKFSLSPSGKSLLGLTPSCPRGRGVRHRHERWDGMRWTRQCRARDGIAGRASARERSQDVPTSDAEAYGEVVWSLRLSGWRQVSGRQVGPTGRGCASYPQTTETTKPDSPGSAK
jgi:hypothetical protein